MAVLAVIAVVAIGGQLSSRTPRERQPSASERGEVDPRSSSSASTPAAAGASTVTPEIDVVQRAAVAGVTAWQDRDVSARNEALAVVASPDYASAMSGVDPVAVPTCSVERVRTDIEADGHARVHVVCDSGLVLDVDLSIDDSTWRVVDIAPGT